MSIESLTFGCRLNTLESAVMAERAAEAGVADALLVNTCAVTAEAVRQARQAIRRAKRERPERKIVVSGCAAQTNPKMFADMPEVDLVLGNQEKLVATSYRAVAKGGTASSPSPRYSSEGGGRRDTEDAVAPMLVGDIFSVRENAPHRLKQFSRARAFVEIQNGCDHRCTFCIIPYGRGASRSVTMPAVIEEVRRLVAAGYREAVLTGVDITAWGADLFGRPHLGELVGAILREVPELPRLRLSSIDSVEADADLFRALAEEERLMPHLHLSLQSGDDIILKRMKRRHSRADAIRFCESVRKLRPDIVFGADLIAGFPTETEKMFESTLSIVEECGLTFLHVFPYSPRPDTPAARMPQLSPVLVQQRARSIRQQGLSALSAWMSSEVGKTRKILLEGRGLGHTEHFAPVEISGSGRRGEIVSARIVAAGAKRLSAQAFQEAA